MSVPSVHFSSASDEWLTPKPVLALVQAVLGVIELDPAADAGHNVPAACHYTQAEDGLLRDWRAWSVYLNPPYGQAIGRWVAALVGAYERRRVKTAIALLPARTDTRWWGAIRNYPVCFVRGRLHFGPGDRPAPFPSALVYFGADLDLFAHTFAGLGDTWRRCGP